MFIHRGDGMKATLVGLVTQVRARVTEGMFKAGVILGASSPQFDGEQV
jgi:hypothetical protein